MLLSVFVFLSILIQTMAYKIPQVKNNDYQGDIYMHRHKREANQNNTKIYNVAEETANYWIDQAQKTLDEQILKKPIKGSAKNVILFLGDGMSIPTLAAARAYLGQKENKPGEETKLSFEKFPFVGLSKTYCVDRQVADSACSATAYLCGVKANEGTIGVTAAVPLGDCEASRDPDAHLESIARWFQREGRSTGLVTTTRVTHASPAGIYAVTANRDWESDSDVEISTKDPHNCPDIAQQLIDGQIGRQLNVILGGGRAKFFPSNNYDNEGILGNRSDGRNLIEEWIALEKSFQQYVWNRTALLEIPSDTRHLLGLFSTDHMPYNLDRDSNQVPSLTEMTTAAIKILSNNGDGYFLFVEGGRIDHAHHDTLARKALNETIEFQNAVQAAIDLTDIRDTLIVVTSDHAHTMSISGYPNRGNDILGIGGTADDKLPYTTLNYANGPGYQLLENGHRHNISNDNLDKDYKYPSLFPRESETHGGDDVAIFALGPWAHLFVGVLEQNVIPHIMAFSACVGDGKTACDHSIYY